MNEKELLNVIKQAKQKNSKSLSLRELDVEQLPSEIGHLQNLETLELDNSKLTNLPTEIENLQNLKSLKFWRFKLISLPIGIDQLQNLSTLTIENSQITNLPAEIGKLQNLSKLKIVGSPLKRLPPEIGRLQHLSTLTIEASGIKNLPTEIGQLQNLSKLTIWGSRIESLPTEIGQLQNLSELTIANSPIVNLPAEIGQLQNLSKLKIVGSPIVNLPVEIGQLQNLLQFTIVYSQLISLPAEIGQLQNLSQLVIEDAQLTSLPAEIGQLQNLSQLVVEDAQLTSLPPEIGQLSSLKMLDVPSSAIEFLPSSLMQLQYLEILNLPGNPLPIPAELLADMYNPKAILKAYFQECTPLHELKLLLLGEGEVGKTSVVERLLHDQPPSDSGRTIGLDIHPWRVSVETAAQTADIAVNLWDFGGQEIYHATHQFFLSHRSLYLLVVDARQDDDANRLAYWLQLIQSFGGDSPIILVVNKIDQGMRRVAERDLREKYPQLKQVVYTSCTTGEGIDELRQVLRHTMGGMDHLREQIPHTWMAVKEKLAGMTADYITYEQFARMCQEAEIQQTSTQAVLARLLHDLGAALNYADESSLAGTYILQPDWVTYGIYQIVNEPRLQANGILPKSMLPEILDADRYPFHKHHILLKMMEQFELCHPMEDGQRRLIPTLLPPDRPGFDWPDNDQARFQLRYGVLPPSIIARLMVRLHTHTWRETRWRDGVVLARHGARARVQADRAEEQINIWLKGDADARRTLLTLIRAQLDEIHASFARLEVEEWVPLPGHPGQAFKYNGLLRLLERGIDTHWDPNTDVQFQVMPLLDSLETPVDRQERRLARLLAHHSLSGLKSLAELDLKIDPESLSHERKIDFVRELIGHCQRRGMLAQLEQLARRRA